MPEGTRLAVVEQTEVGSYFVANYPPFSVWTKEAVEHDAFAALEAPPAPDVPLGLYLHIPFCRKRCHFCYFRVYTDKNAQEVGDYLDVLGREWELLSRRPALAGRLTLPAGVSPRRPAVHLTARAHAATLTRR